MYPYKTGAGPMLCQVCNCFGWNYNDLCTSNSGTVVVIPENGMVYLFLEREGMPKVDWWKDDITIQVDANIDDRMLLYLNPEIWSALQKIATDGIEWIIIPWELGGGLRMKALVNRYDKEDANKKIQVMFDLRKKLQEAVKVAGGILVAHLLEGTPEGS